MLSQTVPNPTGVRTVCVQQCPLAPECHSLPMDAHTVGHCTDNNPALTENGDRGGIRGVVGLRRQDWSGSGSLSHWPRLTACEAGSVPQVHTEHASRTEVECLKRPTCSPWWLRFATTSRQNGSSDTVATDPRDGRGSQPGGRAHHRADLDRWRPTPGTVEDRNTKGYWQPVDGEKWRPTPGTVEDRNHRSGVVQQCGGSGGDRPPGRSRIATASTGRPAPASGGGDRPPGRSRIATVTAIVGRQVPSGGDRPPGPLRVAAAARGRCRAGWCRGGRGRGCVVCGGCQSRGAGGGGVQRWGGGTVGERP